MTRWAIALLLALTCAAPVHAQAPSASAPLSASGTTCTTANACVQLGIVGLGHVAVQLSGTWSGTVQFEGSLDGSNWVALNLTPSNSGTAASSATAVGVWSGAVGGYNVIRVRCSAFSSGSIVVILQGAP